MKPRILPAALMCATLFACSRETPEPSPAPATTMPVQAAPSTSAAEVAFDATSVPLSSREMPRVQFADESLGIAVLQTPGFALRRDFRRDYLAAAEWKTHAEPDSAGTPWVALVLDGSNSITAAELRIGTSNDAGAIEHCQDIADSAESAASDEVRIDGQPFRHFRAGDAGMSHYLQVDSYRAVRHDHCFAIDLLISGTRPEVYDPPPTAPFDQDTARARLQEALAAVRFTR